MRFVREGHLVIRVDKAPGVHLVTDPVTFKDKDSKRRWILRRHAEYEARLKAAFARQRESR